MKKNHKMPVFWAVIVAALLVLAGCTAPAENNNEGTPAAGAVLTPSPGSMVDATEAASNPSAGNVPMTGGDIDEMFIDMMVPHHQGAVEMARIALERSQRPEIQEMANNIIASQEEEITQMKAWKQEWYGSSDTPPMSAMPMMEEMPGMGGMGHAMNMEADVEALRNAPEPFDLAFIDAMIPHHQSAIDAAQQILNAAVHPEMREMAKQVIEEQQKEIEQMTEWRTAWFPDAPAR